MLQTPIDYVFALHYRTIRAKYGCFLIEICEQSWDSFQ
jgi:hypothetical protein